MNDTEKVVMRTACFTDHRTGITALAVEVDRPGFDRGTVTKTSDDTYGKMWLEAVVRVLDLCVYKLPGNNVSVVMVSSQKECNTMANKLAKMWVKLLMSKKQDNAKIEAIVAAAGHYHKLPNDKLYADALTVLWNCKKKFNHFSFDAQRISTPNTDRVFKLAKNMVAPDYVVIKKKSKKSASLL